MAKFLYLLNHAPDRYAGLSPEENMEIIKDYIAWVEAQAEAGRYLGGEKLLETPGKTLRRQGGLGMELHDAPFAEVPEVLGGYMLIEARDMDEAVELARTHPHLVHNDVLHIHEIHDVDGGPDAAG